MKRALVWSLGLRLMVGLMMGLMGVAPPAMAAADEAAERSRIAAERSAVEQRFSAAQTVCQARFVVTDCLEVARAERRQALDRLQRQSNLLDDAKRRERAARRLQAIQQRDAETPPRKTAPAATAPGAASASAPAPGKRPAHAMPPASAPSSAGAGAAARQRQRQAQFQRRQEAARLHEQAVQQRNAHQDAKRKPAAGLPVPGASAAAP